MHVKGDVEQDGVHKVWYKNAHRNHRAASPNTNISRGEPIML